MKINSHSLLLVAALFIQSCATRVFHNKAYFAKPDLNGKTMAVLPVNMIFTGAMPNNLSPEQQVKWEDGESKMVQDMLMHYYRTKLPKRSKATCKLLPVETTNKILEDKGITQRNSWGVNPADIGRDLQADWILKVSIKKDRMMSELASIGVDITNNVIDNLLNGGNTVMQNSGMAKTYNIYLEAQLLEAATGTVLSSFTMQNDASWTNPPERILQRTAKRIVRRGAVSIASENRL